MPSFIIFNSRLVSITNLREVKKGNKICIDIKSFHIETPKLQHVVKGQTPQYHRKLALLFEDLISVTGVC